MMATSSRRVDQRMQHTRQVLQRAFIEVAHEKGMVATTVQDIVRRADVNRGTFYLHFADKYALLVTVIHEHFHHLLTNALPATATWDRRSLYLLIQAVLEDFQRKYRRYHLLPHDMAPLVERATCEELATFLLMWLKQSQSSETTNRLVPLETIAQIMSWTIFEAAIQWSQGAISLSSEQMAHDIVLVIADGTARLAPFALPE